MKHSRLPIDKINPAPYNPRVELKPDDPRFQALVRSIDEFGVVQPLVVNRRGNVLVGGHQRLNVLRARGETEVDVVLVDLSPAKERTLNVALNRIQGEWDRLKLADLLAGLVETPEIDVELSGFDLTEIDSLLANLLSPTGDEAFDVEAELERGRPVVTQPGELIELGLHGEHRLLCGDATDAENLAQLTAGERLALCHTDPTYGVSFDRRNRPHARRSATTQRGPRYSATVRNDDLTPARYAEWFERVVGTIEKALAPGAPFYVWNSHRNFGLMHDLFTTNGFKVASVITWEKESFAPGFGDYNQQTEFCLYGWKRGARHAWHGPKNESTLWSVRRDATRAYRHPTQKALELAERAIRNSSKRGQVVFDPFLGSGTSLIAAARLGRRCFGFEIEARYCDVIVRRYMALAGAGAVSPSIAERYALKAVER